MTQSELWLAKWQEAIDFLETNHRKPSKFIPEERNLRSWWKHNKKLMNAGECLEELEAGLAEIEASEAYQVPRPFWSVSAVIDKTSFTSCITSTLTKSSHPSLLR